MKFYKKIVLFLGMFLCFMILNLSADEVQKNPELKEIIARNIESVGGVDKISKIANIHYSTRKRSFLSYETINFFINRDGKLKVVSGNEPLIRNVILLNEKGFTINAFPRPQELEQIEKAAYTCYAKLVGGGFSLINFEDNLKFVEVKKYGPEKFYVLSTEANGCTVTFCINVETNQVKRMISTFIDESNIKSELVYDFGDIQEVEGLKIPATLFISRIGPGDRPNPIMNLDNISFHQDLPQDFFIKAEINTGKTTVEGYTINFNALQAAVPGNNRVYIETNIIKDDTDKAGYKTGDIIQLNIGDKTYEILFLASQSDFKIEYLNNERIVVIKPENIENYIIVGYSEKYKDAIEMVKPLMPLSFKKIEK